MLAVVFVVSVVLVVAMRPEGCALAGAHLDLVPGVEALRLPVTVSEQYVRDHVTEEATLTT